MFRTTIRLMPMPDGTPRPDLVLGDLCAFNVTAGGWLRVTLRNPANPDYLETRHFPPQQVADIVEIKL